MGHPNWHCLGILKAMLMQLDKKVLWIHQSSLKICNVWIVEDLQDLPALADSPPEHTEAWPVAVIWWMVLPHIQAPIFTVIFPFLNTIYTQAQGFWQRHWHHPISHHHHQEWSIRLSITTCVMTCGIFMMHDVHALRVKKAAWHAFCCRSSLDWWQ